MESYRHLILSYEKVFERKHFQIKVAVTATWQRITVFRAE
jgi:hypothetical protein